MDSLVAVFLAWIFAQTGLTADAPPVMLAPKSELEKLYYGPAANHSSFNLIALYHHPTGTVYLPDTWSAAELPDRSVLLHELVHHVQRVNNVRGNCRAALERQAIELQIAWLRSQGVEDPYELIGSDAFTVRILTSCPEEE